MIGSSPSEKSVRLAAKTISKKPDVTPDSRRFLERFLTSLIISPVFDLKSKTLKKITLKASLQF